MNSTARLCAVLVACTLSLTPLAAQAQTKHLLHVSVTDPLGRFVTGLEQNNFEIIENGTPRPITGFLDFDIDSPISLAIVSDKQLPVSSDSGTEVIQTQSVSDALQQLAASKNPRKALIVTTTVDTQAIPADVQLVQAAPDKLLRAVIEVRNEYVLEFESAVASAAVEVVLNSPRGLPPLQSHLK